MPCRVIRGGIRETRRLPRVLLPPPLVPRVGTPLGWWWVHNGIGCEPHVGHGSRARHVHGGGSGLSGSQRQSTNGARGQPASRGCSPECKQSFSSRGRRRGWQGPSFPWGGVRCMLRTELLCLVRRGAMLIRVRKVEVQCRSLWTPRRVRTRRGRQDCFPPSALGVALLRPYKCLPLQAVSERPLRRGSAALRDGSWGAAWCLVF